MVFTSCDRFHVPDRRSGLRKTGIGKCRQQHSAYAQLFESRLIDVRIHDQLGSAGHAGVLPT